MSKHTPGPWHVLANHPYENNRTAPHRIFFVQPAGVNEYNAAELAILYEAGDTTGRVEANARLIAAAPRLLNELIRLRREVRACWGMEGSAREAFGNSNYSVVQERIDAAAEAIADAGGAA